MLDYKFEIQGDKIKIMDEYGCYWHPEAQINASIICEEDGSFAEPSKVFDRILRIVYGDEYPLNEMNKDFDCEKYDLITTRFAMNATFNIMAKIPYVQLLREIINTINNKIDTMIDEIGL